MNVIYLEDRKQHRTTWVPLIACVALSGSIMFLAVIGLISLLSAI